MKRLPGGVSSNEGVLKAGVGHVSPPNERVSKVGGAAGPLREGVASKGTAAGMSRKENPEGVDDGEI